MKLGIKLVALLFLLIGINTVQSQTNRYNVLFIAVDDLVEGGVGIEQGIKARLTRVVNAIAQQHGFLTLAE